MVHKRGGKGSLMKFKRIATKLQFSFTVIFAVIIIAIVFLTIDSVGKEKEAGKNQVISSAELLKELMEGKGDDALALAKAYAQDEIIIEALKNEDRELMAEHISPIFDAYSGDIGLSVFEIGDKTGTVFFRGHNPEKFGDDKYGKATIQSALNGNFISGGATGSSGIAIRAFAPIYGSEGELLGTMQVGFADVFF